MQISRFESENVGCFAEWIIIECEWTSDISKQVKSSIQNPQLENPPEHPLLQPNVIGKTLGNTKNFIL